MADYSTIDRAFHRLALGTGLVRRASFDIEQAFAPAIGAAAGRIDHVFITGLARSGTTILLQMLHESGAFAAQSYRDMPFVLAPNLWSRLSGPLRRDGGENERAHGDGLTVGFDSVEAFEEVFWLTFCGKEYVGADGLKAHDFGDDVAGDFTRFVAHVIASQPGRTRYLSKNNNNVLRLAGLRRTFPNAHIVIPFRNPLEHSRSLLNQHQRFCRSQRAEPFERQYMSWLGHHEFGLDHRPFRFSGAGKPSARDASRPEYWMETWCDTHEALLANGPAAGAIFWSHDAFCARPARMLERIAARLDVAMPDVDALAARIRPPEPGAHGAQAVPGRAAEIYRALQQAADAALAP